MTRRELLFAAAAAGKSPLILPIHHILDSRARFSSAQLPNFWSKIWTEAVQDLQRCGIHIERTVRTVEVRRSPSGAPIFSGLVRYAINMVITDRIPTQWDNGRGLSGVTTLYEGFHLCVVSLDHAHGHRIPFVSVNTCLHELLHALLLDIFEKRPKGLAGEARELRIDSYATRLWLFGDGAAIRKSAESYVARLRAELPCRECGGSQFVALADTARRTMRAEYLAQ